MSAVLLYLYHIGRIIHLLIHEGLIPKELLNIIFSEKLVASVFVLIMPISCP